jgi:hypothetical protein
MQRSTIPSLTALIVVLFAMGAQAQPTSSVPPEEPSAAQSQEQSAAPHMHRMHPRLSNPMVMVRVDEIIAADTDEGIDQRLIPLRLRLHSLFPSYSTYRLVSRQVGRTHCGRMLAFSLPGGWIVHVEPNAIEDDMIAMHLLLFQGARPLMTTQLKLRNHAMLIVGGPRYQQGMLLIPIGADVPPIALPPVPVPVVPQMPGDAPTP